MQTVNSGSRNVSLESWGNVLGWARLVPAPHYVSRSASCGVLTGVVDYGAANGLRGAIAR